MVEQNQATADTEDLQQDKLHRTIQKLKKTTSAWESLEIAEDILTMVRQEQEEELEVSG